MSQTIIKEGYRITVVSWENDGDNYNTKTVDGYTYDEAFFVVSLCNLLRSKNAVKDCFGNIYDPDDKERNAFETALKNVISQHPVTNISEKFSVYFDINDEYFPDGPMEFLYDLGLSCGERFTRVCESFKVEHIPKDIVIEDVTKNFK